MVGATLLFSEEVVILWGKEQAATLLFFGAEVDCSEGKGISTYCGSRDGIGAPHALAP